MSDSIGLIVIAFLGVIGAIATPLFVATAMVLIANRVGDVNVKLLGYLAAFMGVGTSVLWLAQGGMRFLGYRGLLRQAEAD
jgi:hypothetical protein